MIAGFGLKKRCWFKALMCLSVLNNIIKKLAPQEFLIAIFIIAVVVISLKFMS